MQSLHILSVNRLVSLGLMCECLPIHISTNPHKQNSSDDLSLDRLPKFVGLFDLVICDPSMIYVVCDTEWPY